MANQNSIPTILVTPSVNGANGITWYVRSGAGADHLAINPKMFHHETHALKYALDCANKMISAFKCPEVHVSVMEEGLTEPRIEVVKPKPTLPTFAEKVGWRHSKSRGVRIAYLACDGEHLYVSMREHTVGSESYVEDYRIFYHDFDGNKNVHSQKQEDLLCWYIKQFLDFMFIRTEPSRIGSYFTKIKPAGDFMISPGCWKMVNMTTVWDLMQKYPEIHKHVIKRAEQVDRTPQMVLDVDSGELTEY